MTEGQNIVERPTLHVQLQELNKRSQLYLAQFWQVPLAYLGSIIVGMFIKSTPVTKCQETAIYIISTVAGILIIWHMLNIAGANRRATRNIRAIEKALSLDTVKNHELAHVASCCYWLPLLLIVMFSVIGSLILLIRHLCCSV